MEPTLKSPKVRTGRKNAPSASYQQNLHKQKTHQQIIAGAGAGKTQAVAQRIVDLLAAGTPPAHIVGLCYNIQAAAELKDRVQTLTRTQIGQVIGLAEMFVGTTHAFCLDLLLAHLPRFAGYTVLTDIQARLLVRRYQRQSGLRGVTIITGPSRGQRLKATPKDIGLYLEVLSLLREGDVDPSLVPPALFGALESYTGLLDQNRSLDYSRLLAETVAALENQQDVQGERLRTHVALRCRHVFVDEYQDVNSIQERLLRGMERLGASVTVVGDDDQAIYGWRGSDNRFILSFAERYGRSEQAEVQQTRLEDNFRSSAGIVGTAQSVIRQNVVRLPKIMRAAGRQHYERNDLLALTFETPDAEAAWVVGKIKSMLGTHFVDKPGSEPRGLSYSDMAILPRSVKASGPALVRALRVANVPFIISGMMALFDAPEVQAAVMSIRLLAGDADADAVRQAWRQADLGLTEAELDAGVALLETAKDWTRYDRAIHPNCELLNLQGLYLKLLETFGLREERIPPGTLGPIRGGLVYANLGKFSQVILDFERICFLLPAERKCKAFALWLQYDAPSLYDEAAEGGGYARPDAVCLSTIHQAKGKEWPVVFLPQLVQNRFPLAFGSHGRTKWHLVPVAAVRNAGRYDINMAEERRLFYVALTRSKKWAFGTFAPADSGSYYVHPSPFFQDLRDSDWVLTREQAQAASENLTKLPPCPLHKTPDVTLSFSEMKYLFECPYAFKMRFLYGFEGAPDEGIGFGKGLHDAIKEVHQRALDGEVVAPDEAANLAERYTFLPFASPFKKARLLTAASEALSSYVAQQGEALKHVVHVELPITIAVTGGVTVTGRIDLVRRLDTGEEAIVDFKSKKRVQAEDVSRQQLHAYVLGHEQLEGRAVDVVEVHNLDREETGVVLRERVDGAMLEKTRRSIQEAGDAIRMNQLPRLPMWCSACSGCDFQGICRDVKAESTQQNNS